ncbi:hypothetical protein PBY51_017715 [Eleginops maclovinus]|uniref:Uncharacterized protein n=1 Tax=Eleginops maclovinus TaxID=56733 RepID=A0AAN8AN23_ELEMC|nr:hypothetical protein PBY51_017715 [Eleginops maclovinus]
MATPGRFGQEWRSCTSFTWRKVEEAGVDHPGKPGTQLHSILSLLLAHIYALGVSAVSRWILMCFKEVSLVLPSLTPSPLPPSLSTVLLLRGVSVRSDALGVQTCKDPDGHQPEGLR